MLACRGCCRLMTSLRRDLFRLASTANSSIADRRCIRVKPLLVVVTTSALPCRQWLSSQSKASPGNVSPVSGENLAVKRIRNIALIAHIDAGKTTTTERMLYCSHRTRHLGEVDRGDTVTDYLPEERARGITIVSAAVSLTWRRHSLHLLDTPGHVDFTWEVERCLPVLDGAVTILDGTKGVQAQTRTVERQAEKYQLPRLIFVNKLDRGPASLQLCMSSLGELVGRASSSRCVPIHWPVYRSDLLAPSSSAGPSALSRTSGSGSGFIGLVDLTAMTFWDWSNCMSPEDTPTVHDLLHLGASQPGTGSPQVDQPKTPFTGLTAASVKSALEARVHLLGQLADFDDQFADIFLTQESPELVLPKAAVRSAVRRVTCSRQLTPVLVGSSRCSIGVPSLLDAMVQYLPDPSVRPPPMPVIRLLHHLAGGVRSVSTADTVVAGLWQSALQHHDHQLFCQPVVMLVFKVTFDSHRGPLSLVRVYTGTVQPGSQVANWSQNSRGLLVERVVNVLQLTGDQHETVDSAGPGSIVALTGLQSTHSGDLLGTPTVRRGKASPPGRSRQKEHASPVAEEDLQLQEDGEQEADSPDDPMVELFGTKPDPVVYAAVEPASLSVVRPLEQALACMHREDPSFHARLDTETGQWKIGGMGDLHLEVSMSRLQRHYKVDARVGPMLIAYRESPRFPGVSRGYATGFSRLSGSVDARETGVLVHLVAEASGTEQNQIVFDRSCFGHHHHQDGGGAVPVTGPSGGGGVQTRLSQAIRLACQQTLESSGPLLRNPVVGVSLHLRHVLVGLSGSVQLPRTAEELLAATTAQLPAASLHRLTSAGQTALLALVRAAVADAVREALNGLSGWALMEPMMRVELRLPVGGSTDPLSHFLGDLSARRAEIVSVDSEAPSSTNEDNSPPRHLVVAVAPLAELVGYSAAVRTLSSGEADLHLQLVDYRPVGAEHQAHLVNRLRWSPVGCTAGTTSDDD